MAVVYSSGSTSDPKGTFTPTALVRHAHNLWQMHDLIEDDITPMPLFWVGGSS